MTRKKEEILYVCVTGLGFKPEVDDIEAGGTNIAFQSAQCSCSSRDPTSQVGLLLGGTDAKASRPRVLVAQLQLKIN
ncbi:unnamed protein product [Sphagnum jensenii]|uniref:Uncharacterized protein n=1 Tax=Sphagnum jensenii TaxID=128206 RepID=A0ABP1AXS8_9BRYO